jgi:hypothetical protein
LRVFLYHEPFDQAVQDREVEAGRQLRRAEGQGKVPAPGLQRVPPQRALLPRPPQKMRGDERDERDELMARR